MSKIVSIPLTSHTVFRVSRFSFPFTSIPQHLNPFFQTFGSLLPGGSWSIKTDKAIEIRFTTLSGPSFPIGHSQSHNIAFPLVTPNHAISLSHWSFPILQYCFPIGHSQSRNIAFPLVTPNPAILLSHWSLTIQQYCFQIGHPTHLAI